MVKGEVEEVLVIGGGIAGIKATLEIIRAGKKVHLVERRPGIGGKLVQLHSMYPSMTSPIETLSPMMSECFKNPNVVLHTLSEVKGLEGEPGNFKVTILNRPRFVDDTKCNLCGKCLGVCPEDDIPDEFNQGLSSRKSIYMMHPLVVPNLPCIDAATCRYLKDGSCNACEEACEQGAINLNQKEEEIQLNVAAVVIATGYDLFDPTKAPEYGYGVQKDVFTSMEYERMAHPAGPTGGRIVRRSDGKEPRSVAWIQCVGSRSTQHLVYCCSVGCMNSIKVAMKLRMHSKDIRTVIFYKDLRCYGKGFNEILLKAEKDLGVELVNSDATVSKKEGSNSLLVTYDIAGKPVTLDVDMVVLAQGTQPSAGSAELAEALGVDVNEFNFFKSKDRISAPCESSRAGIFIAGYCHEPKIISEVVSQGEAAADHVIRFFLDKGQGGG